MGRLISLNVGMPREVPRGDDRVLTGIWKRPVEGRVMLRRANFDGDGQADLEAHGGVDKAAYAYPHEYYDVWKRELGRDALAIGCFGENLTIEGFTDDAVRVGDVFRVGEARVEVSQPRVPCFKLGLRMDDPRFPKRFLASGRTGFYLRVLEEGEVGAGDAFERAATDPEAPSVRSLCHLLHFDRRNRAAIERALRLEALSRAWREDFEKLLAGA